MQNSISVVDADRKERNAEDGYPFGLTDEEIHASLETERQIEELARYVGLETTLAALDDAKELAREYGLHNLLEAMRAAVDVHTWRYVKGILKKGGVKPKEEEIKPQIQEDANGDEIRWLG